MNASVYKKVTVLGEGAWGSALAMLFARNGYTVSLWCHHADVAQQIQTERKNDRFFPDRPFNQLITATASLKEAMHDAQIIVEAIPVLYLRSVLEHARPFVHEKQLWIVTSKGIELDTLRIPSQIITDMFGDHVARAVVMGPSFASELAQNWITGFDVGVDDPALFSRVHELFANESVFLYKNADLIGMQLCGALKNLIALGVGILHGSGHGENARALFVARMLSEVAQLINASGGDAKTVYGLAGVGDTLLTAMGAQSRNLVCGKLLGQGHSLSEIKKTMSNLPEGVSTAQSIEALANKKGVAMPLSCAVARIVAGQQDPRAIFKNNFY